MKRMPEHQRWGIGEHYVNMQGAETSASGGWRECMDDTHTHAHTCTQTASMCTDVQTHTCTHTRHTIHTERNRKMLIQFDCLLGHTSNQPKKPSTGMHAPEDGIGHDIITTTRQHPQMSMSTVPMQQVWSERSQNASDKQQTM